jgi:hypothetical protein
MIYRQIFTMAQQLIVVQGLLITKTLRSHTLDTPHSVGPLWTSDQPVAETQHPQATDIYALGGIRTHNPSKRVAADPRLRRLSHWDRHTDKYTRKILQKIIRKLLHPSLCVLNSCFPTCRPHFARTIRRSKQACSVNCRPLSLLQLKSPLLKHFLLLDRRKGVAEPKKI